MCFYESGFLHWAYSLIQGIVPEPEEQEELLAMNTQLLNRVPLENDPFVIDPDQVPGMIPRGLHVVYRGLQFWILLAI